MNSGGVDEEETNFTNAIGHKIQTGFHVPNAVHNHDRLVRRNRCKETRYYCRC